MGYRHNEFCVAQVTELARPTRSWPRWVVTGGGVGYLKPAPGSWGTAVVAGIYWLGLMQGWGGTGLSVALLGFGAVAGVLLVAYGKWAAAYFREIDPGQVVLDEYAGFAVTVAFVPVPGWVGGAWWHAWLFAAGLFMVFRLTDTLKIPPARQLERLPWGWGILLDDVAAGLQANLVAQVVVRIWMM